MKRVLLIDGDILACKFAAASEHNIDWGEGVTTCSADLDGAKANLDAHIEGVCKGLETGHAAVFLSDARNFRKEIVDPAYKSHRKGLKQPLIRKELEQHLRDAQGATSRPLLEADDVIGIIATNPKLYPGFEKIIVSEDKDMLTIPCTLYRQEELRKVSREEADYYHMLQTLTGDRVDGYPGIPNVGPVKAAAILKGNRAATDGLWQAVVDAYELRDLTEADALKQARLARILRHEDYDYTRREPILWTPPTT